jgi:hypothetical protein
MRILYAAIALVLTAIPAQADVFVTISKASQQMALSVDGGAPMVWNGLDRPRRLRHADRQLPCHPARGSLFLEEVRRRADAELGVLLRRLCDPRHL